MTEAPRAREPSAFTTAQVAALAAAGATSTPPASALAKASRWRCRTWESFPWGPARGTALNGDPSASAAPIAAIFFDALPPRQLQLAHDQRQRLAGRGCQHPHVAGAAPVAGQPVVECGRVDRT